MNKYHQLKEKQQQELNEFPLMFAFDQKQFDEGLIKLGLQPTDTDKIYSLGYGGYYKKSDADGLHDMFKRHKDEMQQAIDEDTTGDRFIYDMFNYELANHEYSYTMELDDTLEALNLTIEEIESKPNLLYGLQRAKKNQINNN